MCSWELDWSIFQCVIYLLEVATFIHELHDKKLYSVSSLFDGGFTVKPPPNTRLMNVYVKFGLQKFGIVLSLNLLKTYNNPLENI